MLSQCWVKWTNVGCWITFFKWTIHVTPLFTTLKWSLSIDTFHTVCVFRWIAGEQFNVFSKGSLQWSIRASVAGWSRNDNALQRSTNPKYDNQGIGQHLPIDYLSIYITLQVHYNNVLNTCISHLPVVGYWNINLLK